MKKFFAALLAIAVASPSFADIIKFDANGGGDGFQNANTFDFLPGNALAVGGTTAVGNFASGGSATGFDLLYQARLGSVLDASSVVVPYAGLNSSYEITAVIGVSQVVTGFAQLGSNSVATFDLAPNAQLNFIKFYYNSPSNANDLAGTGFADGQLILEASIYSQVASFNANGRNIQALDQFVTNNYPGVQTVTGGGQFSFEANVKFADPNFFQALAPNTSIGFAFANGNLEIPFRQTDPAGQFFNGTVPNIGSINGASGPDILFQADANGSFAAIPEPSSMVLLATGVVILAGGRYFRRRSV